MSLPSDLISQFVKVTNDKTETKKETTVYGTTIKYNDTIYVKIDGSELLTPISSTADVKENERVTVMIKNHTAIVTGNLSSPAARSDDVKDIADAARKISEFEIIIADKASVEALEAESARIDSLTSDNVIIKNQLKASTADISELKADNVTISGSLTAAEAEITKIKTDKLDAEIAEAKYAKITDLDATNADVNNLEATYGNISSLMFGSATGTTIQTSFSNAVIAQLGDAQIKSAMIESIAASKITSGDIITNNVRVKSQNGLLLISDETIQISDNTRVRVQIGKDAAGDYSVNVWDADGKLMFSEGGITDSAIKDAIIRNDMVSDTANISAHKLDIDSLFDELNGSTNTIKSTQIYLDDEGQTLDVAFKSLTTDTSELQNRVTSQGTQLTAVQGQITSKVWQQDINTAINEVNNTTENLSTQYEEIIQDVDGLSATVSNHTSEISKKADSSTVTTVNNKVTALETNLSGFKTTVSDTYATREDLDNLVIGGRNILKQSGHWTQLPTWWISNGGGITLDTTNTYLGYNTLATTLGNGIAGNNYKFLILDTNKVYTYSAIIKSDKNNAGTNHAVPLHYHCSTDGVNNNASLEVIDYDQELVAGEWKLLYLTFKPLGKYFRPFLYIGSSGDNACNCNIAYIKLEEGNKPTDWSPAPDDMATTIQMNSAIEQKANSITATVEETITEATKYSLKRSTVDLRDAKYDENLYYPVAGTGIPYDGYKMFQVNVQLNSYSTPSWATHDAGFTCNLSARMKAFGWGTAANNMGWIDDFSFGHCDKMPAYIYQMSNASVPVFYLRGGGRYYLYTDYDCTWTIHTSDYTVASQTVSPTATPYNYGPLINNWTDHNDLVSAKSSITQLSDKITTNITETTKLGTRMSTVEQTASGLTTRLNTTDNNVANAAKTATNYMNFSSNGLVVGDMTANTLGKNVLIDSDSVDIRNGSTVLASFGANTVTLGQNAEDSVINLCDGAGTIKTVISEVDDSYPRYDSLALESQQLKFSGKRIDMNVEYTNGTYLKESSMTLMSGNSGIGSDYTITASGNKNQVGVSGAATENYVSSHYDIYAENYTASTNTWLSNRVSVYPLRTQFSKEITIMGNRVTGANNVLWTGGHYMTAEHSCTLSEAVHDQTNGIVLIFSEYNGGNVNSNWHSFFIPKEMVVLHSGAGFCFQMATSNLAYYATKYLYIGNTKISGHDNNSLTGSSTCGITKTNNRFVLRYVIGV